MQTYEIIEDVIRTILTERDDQVPPLKPETQISASGLDSLDVAALVVRLEERLGTDPFKNGALSRFPRTLGELAELYAHDSGLA
jgi:acyl carrier protein